MRFSSRQEPDILRFMMEEARACTSQCVVEASQCVRSDSHATLPMGAELLKRDSSGPVFNGSLMPYSPLK